MLIATVLICRVFKFLVVYVLLISGHFAAISPIIMVGYLLWLSVPSVFVGSIR